MLIGGLLSFHGSLAAKCKVRSTLININSVDSIEFNYYLFIIKCDKNSRSFNTPSEIPDRMSQIITIMITIKYV